MSTHDIFRPRRTETVSVGPVSIDLGKLSAEDLQKLVTAVGREAARRKRVTERDRRPRRTLGEMQNRGE